MDKLLEKVAPDRDTVLTIGVFDGVHLGHQSLIRTVQERAAARNLLSGVITFQRHPEEVLVPGCRLSWLSGVEERIQLIRRLGVDLVAAMPFDKEVAELDARQFMGLLRRCLRMRGLVIGPDFALGKGRGGSLEVLRSLGAEMGFTVETVPPLVLNGRVVSSTAVRQAVSRGDMRVYRELAGRNFSVAGEVIPGARRGRTMGFPTANLKLDPDRALPANGVYATWAICGGSRFLSVTNVGVRPTFDNGARLAEVHILDFDQDIYGRQLEVEFVERLREEKRFDSIDDLVQEMKADVARSRQVLAAEVTPA